VLLRAFLLLSLADMAEESLGKWAFRGTLKPESFRASTVEIRARKRGRVLRNECEEQFAEVMRWRAARTASRSEKGLSRIPYAASISYSKRHSAIAHGHF